MFFRYGLLKVPLFRNTVETAVKGEAHYNWKSVDFMVSQISVTNCILSLELLELLVAQFVIWVMYVTSLSMFHLRR